MKYIQLLKTNTHNPSKMDYWEIKGISELIEDSAYLITKVCNKELENK